MTLIFSLPSSYDCVNYLRSQYVSCAIRRQKDDVGESNMSQVIKHGLQKLGADTRMIPFHPVSGGDINEAYYVETSDEKYFIKLNRNLDREFFEFEASGLKAIEKTNTIRVPQVYQIDVDEQLQIPMLWLEWVEGTRNEQTDVLLGEQLAALHLCEGKQYGWQGVSYIGRLKQESESTNDWLSYYRDFRLLQQVKIGEKLGVITKGRLKKLTKLFERLDEWMPAKPAKSLLHGDLWGGNWIVGKDGLPYLIDPSVLYGDHELEIAFTELFGGFSKVFYEAYQSVFPLSQEYHERKELYQLYYLLVHLNLFGESYGRSVDRILKKYV